MEGRTLPSLRSSRTALPANLARVRNLVMSSMEGAAQFTLPAHPPTVLPLYKPSP